MLTKENIEVLDQHLRKESYIDGLYPNASDCIIYEALEKVDIPEVFINIRRWQKNISSHEFRKFEGEKKTATAIMEAIGKPKSVSLVHKYCYSFVKII